MPGAKKTLWESLNLQSETPELVQLVPLYDALLLMVGSYSHHFPEGLVKGKTNHLSLTSYSVFLESENGTINNLEITTLQVE